MKVETGSLPVKVLIKAENYWDSMKKEKSRSEADYCTMLFLIREGMSTEDILESFRDSRNNFSRKYIFEKKKRSKSQAEHYLEYTLQRCLEIEQPAAAIERMTLATQLDTIEELQTINTPFKFLNKFGGLSGLTCLTGSPKAGKSAIALQQACYSSRKGIKVILIDFENGPARIKQRLEGKKYDPENIYYIYRQEIKTTHLHKWVESLAQHNQVLIIVDSLQRMATDDDQWNSIRKWVLELERLKLKYNCICLAISEKRRDTYDTPSMSAGKGSGSIEYTADLLLDLSRKSGETKLTIVAHRDREIDEDSFTFLELRKNRFKELTDG